MNSESDSDIALNVVDIFEDAKRMLTSHWQMKDRTDPQGTDERVALDWTSEEVDRRLWSDIIHNTAEVDARSILLNVEIAAAHTRLLITKVRPQMSSS